VLHVKKEFRRAIRVSSDDHLPGRVRTTVEMRRALRPARMAGVHLEATPGKRGEIIDFV
jgi:hypothetical protein